MSWLISKAYAEDAPAAAPGAEGTAGTAVAPEGEHGSFPPFNPATFPSQLVWLAITFVALYVLMKRRIVPQIAGILEDRAARLAADVAAAEAASAETDATVAAFEKALADAKTRANAIAFETRGRVHKDIEARRHEAETVLAQELGAAERQIASIKTRALADVSEIATETTEAVVEALVGKSSRDEAAAAVSAVRGS